MAEELRAAVRHRYADVALAVSAGADARCCSGPSDCADAFGPALYAVDQLNGLPRAAVTAGLGCGNPTAIAQLKPGERVLDLGSGGGMDVILAARQVGAEGIVFGVDMIPEMIDLASANAAEAGVANTHFLLGTIENLPLPDAAVDVVISNCVINLSTDKAAAFGEIFRVLASGGRVRVSDVVAEDVLKPQQRAERGAFVGCIAGALSVTEYVDGLTAAGFTDVDVTLTHPVAEQLHGAGIVATKP